MKRQTRQNLGEQETSEETDQSEQTYCPECDGQIRPEGDEQICQDCGLVVDANRIDPGPEWRAFEEQDLDEKRRVGAPMTATLHDRGLTTVMGNVDSAEISGRRRRQLERMQTWDGRAKNDSKDRGLRFSLGEIGRMCSELDLSDSVNEDAATRFREAHDEEIVKGRSYEGMASAAVYLVCRQRGIPRTLDEVVDISRVERTKVTRSYKKLQNELEIGVRPPNPIDFLPRYISTLQSETLIDNQWTQLERQSRYLINRLQERGTHAGRSPVSVVTGTMYYASRRIGMGLTQDHLIEHLDVSENVVRTVYQQICDVFGEPESGTTTDYEQSPLGRVGSERAAQLAELLDEYHPRDDIETNVQVGQTRIDFLVRQSVAICVEGSRLSEDRARSMSRYPEYEWVALGDREELEGTDADRWVPWDQRDVLARRAPRLA